MLKTQIRPSRDLRNNYADVVKSLNQHDHVIITNNGVGESVLISIEEYAKYEEYLHRRFIFEELQKSKTEESSLTAEFRDAQEVFSRIEQRIMRRGL
jgi:prevent-host-death family protein